MFQQVESVNGRLARRLATYNLMDRSWLLIIVVSLVIGVVAVLANLLLHVVVYPEQLRWDLVEYLFIPAGIGIGIALPLVYLDYQLVLSLMESYYDLEEEVHIDFLTEVSTRRHFEALARKELLKPSSIGGGLLILDLDHFKQINSRYGHSVGDDVLNKVGQCINENIRKSDVAGRLGGEEFGVYLKEAKPAEVEKMANRLRTAISNCYIFAHDAGEVVPVSCSMGGVTFSQPVKYRDCFRVADAAMYEVKNNGRNQIKITRFTPNHGAV